MMRDTAQNAEHILGKLISFPTVSGRPNGDIIAYIEDYLTSHGVKVLLDPHEDGERMNLFATIGGAGGADDNGANSVGGIILSGHTDVVPASDKGWGGNPFEMRVADGRLYGRGAVDMKGFLAMALAMVPAFKAAENELLMPLHLAFTFDEEVGCFGAEQMPAFLAKYNIKPAMAVIGEPTGMQPFIGHKGGMELTTIVRGSSGHASKPDGKVNAIYYAAKMIEMINQIASEKAANPDPSSPFDPPYTSLSIGQIDGGEGRNIIPDECRFDWEIRPLPGDDPHATLGLLRDYAVQVLIPEMQAIDPEADIEFILISDVPAMEARPDSLAAQLIARLWTNEKPDVVSFGTDGAYFQQAGMETVVFGPGGMAQMHQPDEYIEQAAIDEGIAFLTRLLSHMCTPS
jgi:acetylornithine deacetylase